MGQDSTPATLDTQLQPMHHPPQAGIILWSANSVNNFFDSLPMDIQANLREYFGTGAQDFLNICVQNFHIYLHLAYLCHHHSLLHACVSYVDRMSLPEESLQCACHKLLNCEVDKLNANLCDCSQGCSNFQRTTAAREFLVLFTGPVLREHPGNMAVFDIRTSNIFNVRTGKAKDMNEGYAVCSYHLENVPYVVISGGNGKSCTRLYRHDVVRGKWDMKMDLKNCRSGHAMCHCAGQIYLVGGVQTPSVEVCQINTKKSTDIGSLPVAVHNMAHVVVDDKIYLFGGETGRGRISAVQCIDTKTEEIIRLKDLPCECSGGQAVIRNETIYIATHQGHMIKYDIFTGNSVLCNHQPFCRRNFAMFTKDGCIFILGGVRTDGHVGPACVLCKYTPHTDHWVRVATFAKHIPIYASCLVQYPKSCPIIPFSSSL